ncbi:IS200/IS605 family transposase [Thiocystis violacea]|uniref:IS200/IS605 family transposase n=1 Tax=Thiocystis violacea TaxID=13725 RepID=UPI0019054330|nr:IS200/IS605 family transposase [Thiocystis violacea]MBK1720303.1 IS200/IS605 family transposase [Thiocystis violacea]
MRSYRKASHAVHDLKVHLIWITKYRYKVLTKDIGLRIRDLIRQVCDQNDIQIIKCRVNKDHVHLYISYPPKLSVSDIVRLCKGRSSRKIQEEFSQLGKIYWGKHFWGIGYASFSSGHVTDEMIQEYLENHGQHPNHNDDEFVVE